MRIELSATPNWLKITWSYLDAPTEAEILNRLSTVGALGNGRRWFAPVTELWRLTELFPKASYSYEAMCVADAAIEREAKPATKTVTITVDTSRLAPLLKGIQNAKSKAVDDGVRYLKRKYQRKTKAK